MDQICDEFKELMSGRIHLLFVEDDVGILSIYQSLFYSKSFLLDTAITYNEALNKTSTHHHKLHCVISDINLGGAHGGINLLALPQNHNRFFVMVSGLKTMELASLAIKSGAQYVFDKSFDSLDRMRDEVSSLAALSFVLRGVTGDHAKLFHALRSQVVEKVSDWAKILGMSERNLERSIEQIVHLSPKKTLALYYAVYMLLSHCEGVAMTPRLQQCTAKMDYMRACVQIVLQHSKADFKNYFAIG